MSRKGFIAIIAAGVVSLFVSSLFAQAASDTTAGAKTLTLRLTVNAGSNIKSGAKIAVLPFSQGKRPVQRVFNFLCIRNCFGNV